MLKPERRPLPRALIHIGDLTRAEAVALGIARFEEKVEILADALSMSDLPYRPSQVNAFGSLAEGFLAAGDLTRALRYVAYQFQGEHWPEGLPVLLSLEPSAAEVFDQP